MEAPEVPLEQAQEHIHEHAHAAHGEGGEGRKWVLGVALSSAIVAALAAVASLQAGHHINEALINQLEASDKWSYYQAKGIKADILAARLETVGAVGKTSTEADKSVEKYAKQQEDIKKEAEKLEKERAEHLEHHEGLARSVTMFQICIAIAAISVLTNRKMFWYGSMIFAAIGIYFMIMGILH